MFRRKDSAAAAAGYYIIRKRSANSLSRGETATGNNNKESQQRLLVFASTMNSSQRFDETVDELLRTNENDRFISRTRRDDDGGGEARSHSCSSGEGAAGRIFPDSGGVDPGLAGSLAPTINFGCLD